MEIYRYSVRFIHDVAILLVHYIIITSPFVPLDPNSPFVPLDPNSPCMNGQVRLFDGRNQFEGRVEICVGGQWGTFCEDRFWDNTDAQVICRQLGYENPLEALAVTAREYGPGVGRIFRNGLNCSGRENRITECPLVNAGFFGFCTHAQDTGVICNGTKI